MVTQTSWIPSVTRSPGSRLIDECSVSSEDMGAEVAADGYPESSDSLSSANARDTDREMLIIVRY